MKGLRTDELIILVVGNSVYGVLVLVAMWRVFVKAGQAGWAAIIPIYNLYILCKIVGRPGWWVLLILIPIVGIFFALRIHIELAKAFGKGPAFGIGVFFLPFIFYPILAFGVARYGAGVRTVPASTS